MFSLRNFIIVVFASILAALLIGPANAQPKLNSATPHYLQIGTDSTVKLAGKFPKWPVKFWCSNPEITIESIEGKDKTGSVTIAVPKEAFPQPILIRAFDAKGVSEPIPLLIGTSPSSIEQEPNNSPKQFQTIKLPTCVTGVLEKNGDIDCFSIDAKKGEPIIASLICNPQFGTTMDGVLQITDDRGFVLMQNDDFIGNDPRVQIRAPKDGTYLIRVFAFPATPNSSIRFSGAATYRYLLQATNTAFIDHTFPLVTNQNTNNADSGTAPKLFSLSKPLDLKPEIARFENEAIVFHPNATHSVRLPLYGKEFACFTDSQILEGALATKEKPLEFPFAISGTISKTDEEDNFFFKSQESKKLRFMLEARSLGFETDPFVQVLDAEGKKVLAKKDDDSKTDPDPILDFTPKKDGVHQIRVSDTIGNAGPRYHYRLTATEIKPDYSLALKQTSLVIKPGAEAKIEIDIIRKDGFKQPIEVSIPDLPSGITCEPVVSKMKEKDTKQDTEKKVTLTLKAAKKTGKDAKLQQPIRIIGNSNDRSRAATFQSFTQKSSALFLTN